MRTIQIWFDNSKRLTQKGNQLSVTFISSYVKFDSMALNAIGMHFSLDL